MPFLSQFLSHMPPLATFLTSGGGSDGCSTPQCRLDMLFRMGDGVGWSPEELAFQHPYLTLGQIHSALAYYWDHQEELDHDIERRLRFVDQVQ